MFCDYLLPFLVVYPKRQKAHTSHPKKHSEAHEAYRQEQGDYSEIDALQLMRNQVVTQSKKR